MKLKKWLVELCSIALLLTPLSAHAQNGTGNSAKAVEKNGNYYLLDLAQAGIQDVDYKLDQSPEFSKSDSTQLLNKLMEGVNYGTPQYTQVVSAETVKYLGHILKKLPDYEQFAYASAVNIFNWQFIDFPLDTLTDTKSGIKAEPVQLAVRYDQTIRINKAIWSKMSVFNQAATILHEVVYASLTPLKRADGSQYQDADAAMEIVASMMDPRHSYSDASSLRFKINGIPKIGFLALDKFVDMVSGGTGIDNQAVIFYNARVTLSAPGECMNGEPTEEHHDLSPERDVRFEFGASDWCRSALAAHWLKLELINSQSEATLGFKDYIDLNQENKKYFGVISKTEQRGLVSQVPGSIGKATLLLPRKTVEECTDELSILLKMVAEPVLVLFPKK